MDFVRLHNTEISELQEAETIQKAFLRIKGSF